MLQAKLHGLHSMAYIVRTYIVVVDIVVACIVMAYSAMFQATSFPMRNYKAPPLSVHALSAKS